jgi:hypothetical protein
MRTLNLLIGLCVVLNVCGQRILNDDFSEFSNRISCNKRIKSWNLSSNNKIRFNNETKLFISQELEQGDYENLSITDAKMLFNLDVSEELIGEFSQKLDSSIYFCEISLKNFSNENIVIELYVGKKKNWNPILRFNLDKNESKVVTSPFFLGNHYDQVMLSLCKGCVTDNVEKKLIGVNFITLNEPDSSNSEIVYNPGFEEVVSIPSKVISGPSHFNVWQKIKFTNDTCDLNYIKQTNNLNSFQLTSHNIGSPDLLYESSIEKCCDTAYEGSFAALFCSYLPVKKGLGYGEYLEQELKLPLFKDSIYRISFYLKAYCESNYLVNNIGVKLTENPFSICSDQMSHKFQEADFLIVNDLDSLLQWKRYEFEFRPTKTINYLTIGGPFFVENIQKRKIGGKNFGSYIILDKVLIVKLGS